MNSIKKVFLLVAILALCALCITGIVYLNNEENFNDYSLDSMEKETYSTYSQLYLDYMDIRQVIEVEGIVSVSTDNALDEIILAGEEENIHVSQGGIFHKGDLLYSNSSGDIKEIYAEYNGIVDRIALDNGEIIMTLSNYEDRFIFSNVAIEYAKYLEIGQEVNLVYDEKNILGIVDYISTIATDNCVAVEILFEDPNMEIYTNSNIILQIVKAEVKSVIAVPESVLFESNGNYFVRVKSGNESELKQVSIGLKSNEGYVEVKDGLTIDDVVLFDTTLNADNFILESESL